jgi:hypothetical protein
MKQVRRSGAEIIAFHMCSDIEEVREMVYQPTVYRSPRVYSFGEYTYCCPTVRQKLPDHEDLGGPWEAIGTYYERTVYRSRSVSE